jgi:hypothetical protein
MLDPSTCQRVCPTECSGVFDRVVVSHLIRGPTRVLWELLPTFIDPNPLVFRLQVGQTANPLADDWQDVGLPVENQYFALDAEQRVWGKTNWTHYRVVVTSPLGTYYSLPASGMGTLDRRGWRIARELTRQRLLKYRVGPAGQMGYLLKRRWTGKPCAGCLDWQTKESRNPNCPRCFGTGFECGYYYPMACVWAELLPKSRHLTIDGQRGVTDDQVVQADMLMADMLSEEDIWVADKTDDRYYIHKIDHNAEVRGIPISATVELRLVPYSSVVYSIPIPEQLRRKGVEV